MIAVLIYQQFFYLYYILENTLYIRKDCTNSIRFSGSSDDELQLADLEVGTAYTLKNCKVNTYFPQCKTHKFTVIMFPKRNYFMTSLITG